MSAPLGVAERFRLHRDGVWLIRCAVQFCAMVAEDDGDDASAVAWWQGYAYGLAHELYDDGQALLVAARGR